MHRNLRLLATMVASLALLAAACDERDPVDVDGGGAEGRVVDVAGGDGTTASVSGTIEVDGSSTVAPLTNAIYEEYSAERSGVTVNVGVSGTGGGFDRFCGSGDTDISNASRAISDEEVQLCADNGIEFTEIRVGTDALSMVVNPGNDWVECLDDEQIAQIWGADRAEAWSDVDGIEADEPITIFAAASTSGTYDFFNETVGVEEPTQDYSATENDNDVVRGVAGTPGGWGFLGFAFVQGGEGMLKTLAYDAGEGCVAPSVENVQDDSYGLARPLFIYVRNDALARPEVEDFVRYYLENTTAVIESVGYIPAREEAMAEAMDAFEEAVETAG